MTLQNTPDSFDRQLSKRLAGLGNMPMDLSSFDRAMQSRLPEAFNIAPSHSASWRVIFRPFAAVAASLILMIIFVVALQGRQLQASTDVMARMHRDIVAGTIPTMKADSIEAANTAFAAFGTDLPKLSQPPESHTMACCMRNVGDKKVACVLLDNGGTPVTMAVAEHSALQTNGGGVQMRDGQMFHVQTSDELTMVSFDRGNHRVCLIGALSADKLMSLARGLNF